MHPVVMSIADAIPGCRVGVVSERNLVLSVDGNRPGLVAITTHLDKINHFGENPPDELPFSQSETHIIGQMDDAAGVGMALSLLSEASRNEWPSIMVLLSEMEESFGLKHHPELLRQKGEGLYSGMGAERIGRHLLEAGMVPDIAITLDTTPVFKGEPGVALYSGHWEFTDATPSEAERSATEEAKRQFLEIDPHLRLHNSTNDYLTYGKELNRQSAKPVPSLALEPAIFPYHTRDEQIHIKDINRMLEIMHAFLNRFSPSEAPST